MKGGAGLAIRPTYKKMVYREYYRRHLPHWQPLSAVYFVTFRLANSIPLSVIKSLQREKEIERRKLAKISEVIQRHHQDYLDEWRAFSRWDEALDRSAESPDWLSQPEIAEIVSEALHYRDGKVYDLLAYCIMPNHVHFVGRIANPAYMDRIGNPAYKDEKPPALQSIMQSLKRHTARQANILLGRQGTFWQEENYDHVARDNEELNRIIQYVLNNPVKAGMVENWEDWRWTYCLQE